MFTIFGDHGRHSGRDCDGLSRRGFLTAGALGFGGLTLVDLLRAEAEAAAKATGKSLINIFLRGGPSHIDMFDMKPLAPPEVRGEFHPIATKVPGLDICELMPQLAGIADKYAVIRSITGLNDEHSNSQADSGWPEMSLASIGGHPSIGAVMTKLFGADQGAAPTFVDLTDDGVTRAGFLGPVYEGYRPDEGGRANLKLNAHMSLERLGNRRALLGRLDHLRRDVDNSGMMHAADAFTERAFGLVSSGKMADALDLSREDPRTAERYGIKDEPDNRHYLLARRLVEAGVRCVSVGFRGWDMHEWNFKRLKSKLPHFDRGLSALITDMEARGTLDDTLIMVSGEFGRAPRINKNAGRHHWPRAAFFLLAGGGLKTGQVIGSTSRLAEVPKDRPIHYQQVFAVLYRQLGIDPNSVTLIDPNGRPQYLIDHRELIHELL
jgi:hypothetical protein